MNIREPRMYVLVRKDLDQTYRCVQGAHAVVEYSLKGDLEAYNKWHNSYLIFLGVRNESALNLWAAKLDARKKRYVTFKEPDLNNQTTAIACIDTGEIFKHLNFA